jgi:hypothetical protein
VTTPRSKKEIMTFDKTLPVDKSARERKEKDENIKEA